MGSEIRVVIVIRVEFVTSILYEAVSVLVPAAVAVRLVSESWVGSRVPILSAIDHKTATIDQIEIIF